MTPRISIIIPLYNKANVIKQTLVSALNQSFNDFEIIIINDGSTDNSLHVVNSINDNRIHVYTTKNQGVSAARNYGISKAVAEYVAFLDADDIWKPNHLENLNLLQNQFPNCGLYCAAYEKQYKSFSSPAVFNNIPNDENWMGIVTDYFESSFKNSIAWTSAVMVPKEVLKTLNGFDEAITLGAGEDTDLWIRIALQYPVALYNSVSSIHNLKAENRISNSKTHLRNFINLDAYEVFTKNNPSLKRYLDINRFAIGMQYKLTGNDVQAENYFNKINPDSLNRKQRFLMSRNTNTLKLIKQLQYLLRKNKLDFTPFH
ncbi:glycosyltransferase family 2 protein [Hanstruepera marina]|uniref:glycosyltransferase family 2 protein n=1 Tax=Hanstruepera marina TaxID=2873265 RepID=UPI001CA6B28A|nr:glycosyltransferase family A protein [Hanstruepera marina]